MSQHIINQRYHVLALIDEGSMGKVYRATDRLTGGVVALKSVQTAPKNLFFASRGDNSQDFNLALASEFKVLASLRHPHIVGVKDYGFDSNRRPYLTMDLLENAQTILAAGKNLPLPDQIRLIGQLLLALSYLHRRGFLHRDLKPSNILVVDGQVKVLDFGLSVALEQAQSTSGTLAYLAPEILQGGLASPASDLYAVGVILYQLIMGNHPFLSDNANEMTHNILYTAPSIDTNRISTEMASVLKKLLAKRPADRFSDTRQVMHDLSKATNVDLPVETLATRESFLQASRFIGREREMGQITSALDNAFAGQGSAWFIGGESGVGKSRLLDEINTQALVRGSLVLRGQPTTQGSVPYAAWQNPLRLLVLNSEVDDLSVGILMAIIPDIANLLGRDVSPAPDVDSAIAQNRLVNAIDKLFQAQQQPTLLLLEDLEWSVEDRLILNRLLPKIGQISLLIVVAYRSNQHDLPDEFRVFSTVQRLTLEPFSHEQVTALSESMLGSVGRYPAVVELLQRETEGNAFFLVEVVRALAEDAGRLSDIGKKELPDKVFAKGIEQAVQRRLDRVPADSRLLLTVAAAIGRELDLKVLEAARLSDDLNQWLERCADAAVLEVRDERWRFSHDKLREGLLRALTGDDLRTLYQKTAPALEAVYGADPQYSATLTYHWRMAEDGVKEKHYIILAAKQANYRGFPREAVTFLERALALDDTVSDVKLIAAINYEFGHAYEHLGMLPEAVQAYQESLISARAIPDNTMIAESLCGVGITTYRSGNPTEALPFFDESLTLCRHNGNRLGEGRALGSLGAAHYLMGQFEQALAYFQAASAIFQEMGALSIQGRTLSNMSAVLNKMGRLAEAIHSAEQSLALVRQVGDRLNEGITLSNLAMSYFDQGRADDAIEAMEQSLAIANEVGDRRSQAITLNNIGSAYTDLGQLKRASAYHQQSLNIRREIGDKRGEGLVLYNLGYIQRFIGQISVAIDYFDRALVISRELNDREGEGLCLAAIGSAYTTLNDHQQALSYLQNAATIASEVKSFDLLEKSLYYLAYAYLVTNRVSEALQEIQTAHTHDFESDRQRILALYSIIAARAGQYQIAVMTAQETIDFASMVITKMPTHYSARYTYALALSLKATLTMDTAKQAEMQQQAIKAYQEAVLQCNEPGVIDEARRLLDNIRWPDSEAFIQTLKAILA